MCIFLKFDLLFDCYFKDVILSLETGYIIRNHMSFKNEFEKCEGFNQVFDSWFLKYTHKNRIYMRYACFSVVLHTQSLCPFLTEKYGWSNHEATLNELPNQVMIIIDGLPDDAVWKGKVSWTKSTSVELWPVFWKP